MPSVQSRLSINNPELFQAFAPVPAAAAGSVIANAYSFSATGNPAPNRGLTPLEYMYQFDTDRTYPNKFTFRRRSVDGVYQTRNTALQALALGLGTSVTR